MFLDVVVVREIQRNAKEYKGSTDSNSPAGPKETACATRHCNYTMNQRASIGKAKAPSHSPLPPAEAVRKK